MALAVLLVPRDRPGGLEQVWSRFSVFAGLSVLGLMVTGTVQHLVVGGTATSRSGVLLVVEVLALAATLLLSRYAVAYGRRLAFRERYLRGFPVEQSGQRSGVRPAIGVQLVLSVALVGVAVAQLAVLPVPGRPGTPVLGDLAPTAPVATAREARPVDSDLPVRPRADRPAGWRVRDRRSRGHRRTRARGAGGARQGRLVGRQLLRRRRLRVDRDRRPRRHPRPGPRVLLPAVAHRGRRAAGVERGQRAAGVHRSPRCARSPVPTWSTTRRSSTSTDRPGWC